MVLREHPAWKWIKRKLVVEPVNDTCNPRVRIEAREDCTDMERAIMLNLVGVTCVACGSSIQPIRSRSAGGMYFAAACPLEVNVACSRGRTARDEYEAMRTAILSVRRPKARRYR
jgi:hypothetical protein